MAIHSFMNRNLREANGFLQAQIDVLLFAARMSLIKNNLEPNVKESFLKSYYQVSESLDESYQAGIEDAYSRLFQEDITSTQPRAKESHHALEDMVENLMEDVRG